MAGAVITFYSYKGGVGRSFAVANIAVILAQWGYRVLAVDWDIEAPGLNHYFAAYGIGHSAGVIDFLNDCKKGASRAWDAYARSLSIPECKQNLFLMPAAAEGGTDYTASVQALDWDELYIDHDFGARIEELRAAWVEQFDIVLIDSRTGVTDFSGLTTAQLPDVLAFLFTANQQSLAGCCDIVRRAMEARRRLPIDRPALCHCPFRPNSNNEKNMIVRKRGAVVSLPIWRSSTMCGLQNRSRQLVLWTCSPYPTSRVGRLARIWPFWLNRPRKKALAPPVQQ
jgi:hypothetical protein